MRGGFGPWVQSQQSRATLVISALLVPEEADRHRERQRRRGRAHEHEVADVRAEVGLFPLVRHERVVEPDVDLVAEQQLVGREGALAPVRVPACVCMARRKRAELVSAGWYGAAEAGAAVHALGRGELLLIAPGVARKYTDAQYPYEPTMGTKPPKRLSTTARITPVSVASSVLVPVAADTAHAMDEHMAMVAHASAKKFSTGPRSGAMSTIGPTKASARSDGLRALYSAKYSASMPQPLCSSTRPR